MNKILRIIHFASSTGIDENLLDARKKERLQNLKTNDRI